MPAIEPLHHLLGIDISMLTHREIILLEADLLSRICAELKEVFREQQRNNFWLMKLNREEEDQMLESRFSQYIINDIIATREYDVRGIACYANSYEEVIEDLKEGRNDSPSAALFRRLIDLHRSVRRDLYDLIIKKIFNK